MRNAGPGMGGPPHAGTLPYSGETEARPSSNSIPAESKPETLLSRGQGSLIEGAESEHVWTVCRPLSGRKTRPNSPTSRFCGFGADSVQGSIVHGQRAMRWAATTAMAHCSPRHPQSTDGIAISRPLLLGEALPVRLRKRHARAPPLYTAGPQMPSPETSTCVPPSGPWPCWLSKGCPATGRPLPHTGLCLFSEYCQGFL